MLHQNKAWDVVLLSPGSVCKEVQALCVRKSRLCVREDASFVCEEIQALCVRRCKLYV